MLVVNRFRAPAGDPRDLRADLRVVHDLLAGSTGYVEGHVGRNLDDPDLWVLTTRWESTGAYRRALSTYDFKLHGLPLMISALDEPSAYELVEPDSVLNVAEPRVT
ncbi:antibiotic biosynthesis monooxygenase family protein [Nocardioides caeni]|uniref:Antibiotic biosynthesis monooxygenase n=1 Tax=Nocardioides caeni TaxID=574700 RepID=A0A4S8NMV5_9ACTN|nr:antibiotic biosynthesis monooxygenase family protein [Nocardioides caeni]THV17612.1 antibiotic biosynthesis monooxygenase [Nocardioides caeni]